MSQQIFSDKDYLDSQFAAIAAQFGALHVKVDGAVVSWSERQEKVEGAVFGNGKKGLTERVGRLETYVKLVGGLIAAVGGPIALWVFSHL